MTRSVEGGKEERVDWKADSSGMSLTVAIGGGSIGVAAEGRGVSGWLVR
jgi:hypothetical protein